MLKCVFRQNCHGTLVNLITVKENTRERKKTTKVSSQLNSKYLTLKCIPAVIINQCLKVVEALIPDVV